MATLGARAQGARAEAPREEIPWRGLHWASVGVNLLPRTLAVLRNAWPLLVAALYGRANGASVFDAAILAFFLVSTVGSTVLHWLTLRYRVHGGRLEIQSGLLQRQVRQLDVDRVQNVEIVQNVLHVATGLAEVRVETASGTEVEGMLSAVTREEAERLVRALSGHTRTTEPTVAPTVLLAQDAWDLLRYGATDTRVGTAAVVIVGVALDGLAWLDPERVEGLGGTRGIPALIAGVVLVVSAAWLLGIASAILRHFGFVLTLDGARLVASEGLFTRRRVELRQEKVQVVTVSEPLLRRWAGFGSLHVDTAAPRIGGGGVESAQATLAVVDRGAFDTALGWLLPRGDWRSGSSLERPADMALYAGLVGATIRTALLTALLGALMWPYGLLIALSWPIQLAFAWLDHARQGFVITERLVVAREGFWHQETTLVDRSKLQSVELSQGPLLKLLGLARVRLKVAGRAVDLPDLTTARAETTVRALSSWRVA